MQFAEPDRLLWLLLIPALLVLVALTAARSYALRRRFADATMLKRLAPGYSIERSILRSMLFIMAIGCVVAALARPWWGSEERSVVRTGRDVAFLIDVSRSMLAEDLAPNRLERAKLWVDDALNARAGDRVAIIGFAGGTAIASPLTFDVGYARLALRSLDTESVTLGGTNLGDAIRRTVREVFELTPEVVAESRQRDLVIITDGEDHESLPIEAAAAAGEMGIRIIAIGIGSTGGVNIPITDESGRRKLLEYEGEPVVSRLDMATLRSVAAATPNGQAIEVETGDIDLADVYASLARAAISSQESLEETSIQHAERFQWFLLPAIGLLLCERLVPASRRATPEVLR